MLQSAARLLANLSVAKKLFYGFGLVLLFTITVTCSGFVAVDAVLQGHSQANRLSEIDTQILQARRLERDFAASRSDATADSMRSHLGKVHELLATQISVSTVAQQARLQVMDKAVEDYSVQFEGFVRQQAKAFEARSQMARAAQEALVQFGKVESDMYEAVRLILAGGDLNGSDPLTLATTVAGLNKRMFELRGYEELYLVDGSPTALDDWDYTNYELQRVTRGLKLWLGDNQKHTLEAIEVALQALAGYQQAFASYQEVRTQNQASEAAMVEAAHIVSVLDEEAKAAAEASMRDTSRKIQLLLGTMGGAAVLLGFLATLLISRSIVAPLRQIVAIAQCIAEGDLSQDLSLARRDELGQLMVSMQSMIVNLRSLVGRIGGGVSQIAAAAEQLSTITAQTSAGVLSQKLETEQTATAMHEMAATVQEVAKNAEQASQAARAADHEAQQGNSVVQQAVSQIDSLAAEVELSAKVIQALNQESERIGSVLEVIRNVAEQTNLLALNAAIEAARAGEQGRGFAVVADEVRALARRAQDSTEEIDCLIARLQYMAKEAVEKMEFSRVLTQRTVTLAGQAGDALGRITHAVSTIERMNQQISSATEEQSMVAETISESISRVRDIGEQSASASQQTAASSAELSRLGGQLQSLVQQFRT